MTAIKVQKKKKKKNGEKRTERYQREMRASERYHDFLRDMAKMVNSFPAWLRGPLP